MTESQATSEPILRRWIIIPLAGAFLCLLHGTFYAEEAGAGDVAIHLSAWVLKLLSLAIFPFALAPVYRRLHRNKLVTLRFSIALSLGYLIIFFAYTFLGRETLAEVTSDGTTRFYYTESEHLDEYHYIGLDKWREEWRNFVPQEKELLLASGWLFLLVLPGYFVESSVAYCFVVSLFLYGYIFFAAPLTGLVLVDYDFFLGGVFFDLLWFDLFPLLLFHVGTGTIVFFTLISYLYISFWLFVRFSPIDSTPALELVESSGDTHCVPAK